MKQQAFFKHWEIAGYVTRQYSRQSSWVEAREVALQHFTGFTYQNLRTSRSFTSLPPIHAVNQQVTIPQREHDMFSILRLTAWVLRSPDNYSQPKQYADM